MKKRRRDQSGVITVDFLFAIVLVLGFTGIMFSLALTLTAAEIAQYITYASARNYFVSSINEESQRQYAVEKFNALKSDPTLGPLFANGWFELTDVSVGDISQLEERFQTAEVRKTFIGVRVQFIARMLDFRVPFYGSTAADSDGSGDGFSTFVGSYLGREPTVNECYNFTAERWERIKAFNDDFAGTTTPQPYAVITDNGC